MTNKLLAPNNAFSVHEEMNTNVDYCCSEYFYFYMLLYGDDNQYKNNCHLMKKHFHESTKDTYHT